MAIYAYTAIAATNMAMAVSQNHLSYHDSGLVGVNGALAVSIRGIRDVICGAYLSSTGLASIVISALCPAYHTVA